MFFNEYIRSPEQIVPSAENNIIYEKRVPEIKACPKTFTISSKKNAGKEKISIPIKMGRFAKPILKKGSGLGIVSSITERKKQKPPKRGTSLSASLLVNDTLSIRRNRKNRQYLPRSRNYSLKVL